MTTTIPRAPTSPDQRTAGKVAAVASALFAGTFVLTTMSVNVPWKASDKEILDWWQQSANLSSGILSQLFAVSAAVLFVVVINYVRVLAADTGMTQWSAFAHSMATAFCATLLVTSALRGVIGQMVQYYDEPLPGLDVLRYSTALNYTLLGTATMTAMALTMVAVSVIVLRTQMLPTWLGYVGLLCAAVIIGVVAVGLGGLAIPAALLWSLCLAAALWRHTTSTS